MKRLLIVLMLSSLAVSAQALPFRSELNRGNDLYHRGLFDRSAKVFESILGKKKDVKAQFNLGDSLYQQGKYAEAEKAFEQVSSEAVEAKLQEKALYNLGNARFRQENYQGAVDAYTAALRIDPQDEDAQYNLALAKKMLQMPPQQRPKQNKKEQKKQQPKENKNDPDKNKDKQKQQPQPQSSGGQQKLSKEDAERILQGLNNDEKHKAKKMKAGRGQNDKDW